MKNPSITVLMAVYNGEKYIRSSVESVLQQSFADFEFVIINDHSTDQTLSILEEYRKKDPRIVLHTNSINLGQTKSLNVGLRMARGAHIARMDADDFALPGWLETQAAAIKAYPAEAVISAQALVIDGEGVIRRKAMSPVNLADIILRSFTFSPINHVGSVMNKEAVVGCGGYDECYKTAADFDLWGKLLRSGKRIRSSPDVLVAIRMHAQSYSMTEIGKGGLAEISSIMKKNIDYFTRGGISDQEVDVLCQAFYREGALKDDEFERAIRILRRIYADMSDPALSTGKPAKVWSAARRKVAYLKRIHFLISQNNIPAARSFSIKGVKEFGPLSVFTVLGIASILGGTVLGLIPKVFNWALRQKTLLRSGVGDLNGAVRNLLGELNARRYYCDFLGFFSIGIFCLGYALFYRQFAEMNVQLPFLNFPIFAGEILLFVCLCAYVFKGDARLEKKHFWILGYFAFIVVRALYGYVQYGPLALRHAALFYYPAFIVFTHSFYRKEFFDREKSIVMAAALMIALAQPGLVDYFLFTCLALACILIYAYPKKLVKYLALVLFISIIPYKSIVATSRMGLVANFAAGAFLIAAFYIASDMKRSRKLAIAVVVCVLLAGLVDRFADKHSLITLFRPSIIIEKFTEHDELAKELRSQNLIIGQDPGNAIYFDLDKPRQIRIYNPDQPRLVPKATAAEIPARPFATGQASQTVDSLTSEEEKDQEGQNAVEATKAAEQSLVIGADQVASGAFVPPLPFSGVSLQLAHEGEIQAVENAGSMEPKSVITDTAGSEESTVIHDEVKLSDAKDNAALVNESAPPEIKPRVYFDDVQRQQRGKGVQRQFRDLGPAYGNAVFRLIIWRDMLADMIQEKKLFGFSFGKPFRSVTLETLMWGYGDWRRDGWIGAHNSFMEIIYRMGIIGLGLIGCLFRVLFWMAARSIRFKSPVGILLCSIIVFWLAGANFLMILELPYTAIPIWSIFGLAYVYISRLKPAQ